MMIKFLENLPMKQAVALLPAFFITLLGFLFQLKLPFASDVAYLIHAAGQLLAGGNYVSDIFETNPPMILYLYIPVCLVVKWTGINLFMALYLYIFTLALASAALSFVLLKKLLGSNRISLYGMLYTILIVTLIFPLATFGQRENILLIFMIPYLWSVALTLENKKKSNYLALVIGLFAGIGFALKPFFLIPLCLIELYVIIKKRNLFASIRIEPLIIFCVLVSYLISIFIFQPNYIKIILPLISRYYFLGIKQTWASIFSFPNVIFCLGVSFSYLIIRKYDREPTIGMILWLALIGMIAAFMVIRSPWYYHVLPALGLAFLLLIHFFTQGLNYCLATYKTTGKQAQYIVGLTMVVFVIAFAPLRMGYQLFFYSTKTVSNPLVSFFNSYGGEHSIFCLSSMGTHHCFPLVYLSNSYFAERFPFLWWYMGLRIAERNGLKTAKMQQILTDKAYLIGSVAEDLNRYQARWVLMDEDNKLLDYINYFSTDTKFKAAWQAYHYVTSIAGYKIYERNSGIQT